MLRKRAYLAIVLATSAMLSSSPGEEPAFEVFNSAPGPFFTISTQQSTLDFLITIEASPSAFPPDGGWTELVEVEIDVQNRRSEVESPRIIGRLARVAPDGRSVLSSTVADALVERVATIRLIDGLGRTDCTDEGCTKQYVVRFVLVGLADLSTRWFIRAGIDWVRTDLDVPESGTVTIDARAL